MWQFNRMRNNGYLGRQNFMARNTMDPHSPWNEKGARAQELRKTLFPTFKRIPGRKLKFFVTFCFFLNVMSSNKYHEIQQQLL
jgi:hypothetical protein